MAKRRVLQESFHELVRHPFLGATEKAQTHVHGRSNAMLLCRHREHMSEDNMLMRTAL